MDLQSSPSTATLRTALDVPEGTLIGNHHRVLIQRTRGLIHTVKFVSKPRPGTCVAFAFGLSNDPVYKTIAQDFGRKVFAGKRFVEWMIRHRLQEIDPAKIGSLVLYFSGSDWRHIGTETGLHQVTSQWGTYPIYEHGRCEVPERYGDVVRFFDKPLPGQALADFLDYARSEGVSNEAIKAIIAEEARPLRRK
jgi:hypothetical protein